MQPKPLMKIQIQGPLPKISANGVAVRSIVLPWVPTTATAVKGVIHLPSKQTAGPGDRDALLTAIAKARAWIRDLTEVEVSTCHLPAPIG